MVVSETTVKMQYTATANVLPEYVDAYLEDGWSIVGEPEFAGRVEVHRDTDPACAMYRRPISWADKSRHLKYRGQSCSTCSA